MKSLNQSLLPAGVKGCDSMKAAFEMLLDCKCSEFMGAPYEKFCNELGVHPNDLTIREALAHAALIKGLSGDVNAQKFVTETTDGKPKDAEVVESPLKQLSDERLDELVNKQKLIEGGGE